MPDTNNGPVEIKMERVQFKRIKVRGLRKFWLLIKRLLSKDTDYKNT
ncbi:hypothetical protein PAERUG_E6_London_17_VIM_2_12_12_04075 [Pseudomonas aeruginosa]|nr:hypothetical protein [Pseudomonas phage IR-QUMS-PaBa1-GHS-2021]CRQ26608.1 hypothetical protein PAERUG_E6_London_17_VIM_2_12_12_04075 [Pseudomonas aeruginosa]